MYIEWGLSRFIEKFGVIKLTGIDRSSRNMTKNKLFMVKNPYYFKFSKRKIQVWYNL
jgi:hypothetical protein